MENVHTNKSICILYIFLIFVNFFIVNIYISESVRALDGSVSAFNDTEPPTIPMNLIVEAVMCTEIQLAWDASTDPEIAGQQASGIAGYKIYRNGIHIATSENNQYTDKNLLADTNYKYSVSAYDNAGNVSKNSSDVDIKTGAYTVTPDSTSPKRPGNAYAFAAGSDRIDISWIPGHDDIRTIGEEMTGVVEYNIYRDNQLIDTVSDTFYSDTGLEPESTHTYTIYSVDGTGRVSHDGRPAKLSEVVTSIDPSPLQVTIISPVNGSTISGIASLEVQVSSSTGSTPNITMTTIDGDLYGGGSLPYARNIYTRNLKNGTHIIRVYASDDQGGCAYAEAEVTVNNEPESPAPEITIPAFPGAEGFGAGASGGRGGEVVYVTNLNENGPGSLNAALAMNRPRYILFKSSGLINSRISIRNGNLTYAGHTSPGGVIMRGILTGDHNNETENRDNMILRHLRSRAFDGDAFRIGYAQNVIIDHGSFERATDESGQIITDYRYSIQNSIFAETVNNHFIYGGVLLKYSSAKYPLDKVTIHHNLFTRLGGRFPQISYNDYEDVGWRDVNSFGFHKKFELEVSNNLYWDIGGSMTVGSGSKVAPYMMPGYTEFKANIINNYMEVKEDKVFGLFTRFEDKDYPQPFHLSGNRMSNSELADYQLIGNNGVGNSEHPLDMYCMGPVQITPERYDYPWISYDCAPGMGNSFTVKVRNGG